MFRGISNAACGIDIFDTKEKAIECAQSSQFKMLVVGVFMLVGFFVLIIIALLISKINLEKKNMATQINTLGYIILVFGTIASGVLGYYMVDDNSLISLFRQDDAAIEENAKLYTQGNRESAISLLKKNRLHEQQLQDLRSRSQNNNNNRGIYISL
jgi:hypothetical protein